MSSAASSPARVVPESRDLTLDLTRVACVVLVVFVHILFTGVGRRPDGSLLIERTVEGQSWFDAVSWILNIMPLFFVVGGFAARAGWRSAQRRAAGRRRVRATEAGAARPSGGRCVRVLHGRARRRPAARHRSGARGHDRDRRRVAAVVPRRISARAGARAVDDRTACPIRHTRAAGPAGRRSRHRRAAVPHRGRAAGDRSRPVRGLRDRHRAVRDPERRVRVAVRAAGRLLPVRRLVLPSSGLAAARPHRRWLPAHLGARVARRILLEHAEQPVAADVAPGDPRRRAGRGTDPAASSAHRAHAHPRRAGRGAARRFAADDRVPLAPCR